ncbi:MAG TPA: electron transport complex subunit E [Acholeplasma sp.]|jgi:electron transport complex protein RnfE|nr:electron transport complex subunit E [Acholeplasma sp.]
MKKENSKLHILTKGFIKENPLFVLVLGMCPSLAITTSLENALGMGVAVVFVLVMSNIIISAIRKIVPNEIRIPVYIVVIAAFVSIVEMVMAAFLPGLHQALGIFIPLITVNCIILGRAEAFASENTVFDSFLDGLGMGLGFTMALAIIATIREFLGTGGITIWGDLGFVIGKDVETGVSKYDIFTKFFTTPAGGFIVLGIVFGVVALLQNREKAKKEAAAKQAQETIKNQFSKKATKEA